MRKLIDNFFDWIHYNVFEIFIGVIILVVLGLIVVPLVIWFNTASFDRAVVDLKSDLAGGMEREINVYTADGELINHFEGQIDIDAQHDGAVKFDFEGKRYIYYNCFVETIGEIE